ncbi:hypothetical protein [Actinoplanes sp. NPDC049802]|uniref:hypothetical protein n=1 Tax=Actinoplanes sp. NPDC049802 TaxID=3154742 RepID=UPI0033FCD1C9
MERPSTEELTLVADCVDLWTAGEMKLKPLAAHYRTVVASISTAERHLGALWRSEMVGGPYGPARSAWESLAETAIAMLRETADNLEATGDALVMASEMYAETEDINAEAIRKMKAPVIAAATYDPATPPEPGGVAR